MISPIKHLWEQTGAAIPTAREVIRLFCIVVACSPGCSGTNDTASGITNGGPPASDASGGSGGSSGVTAISGTPAGAGALVLNVAGSDATSSGGSAGNAGNGTPETCDGMDNDDNGVIDDVDAGGDGVCDCLNIATLGDIGPWGQGNVFTTWLNARSPRGAVALADQVLTADILAPFQIIVSLHVATGAVQSAHAHHAFSDAEVSAFNVWVRGGGGIMTTIGYMSDEANEIVNVNKLLTPLGMGYDPAHLNLDSYIQSWDPHPVTMGVTNIFTQNGVAPRPPTAGGAVIAHGGNEIALAVTQADSGRAVVWGDEWITYDALWTDVQNQQVELFWLNILKWLSPPKVCQVPIPPRVVK
jgi:hypothetical protein